MTTSFFNYFPQELLVTITHMIVWDDPFCLRSIALISKSWREAVKIVCKELCEKFSFAPEEVLKNDNNEVNWISLFGRLYPSTYNLCCGRILTRTLFECAPNRTYSILTAVSLYSPSSLTSSSSSDSQHQREPSGLGGLLKSLLPWKKHSNNNSNNNLLDIDDDTPSSYFLEIWEPPLQLDCIVYWTLHVRSSWGPGVSSLGWNEYDLTNEKHLIRLKQKNTLTIDINFPQYSKVVTVKGIFSRKRGDTVFEKLGGAITSNMVIRNSNPYAKPNFVLLDTAGNSMEVYDVEALKSVCTLQKKGHIVTFYYPYILWKSDNAVMLHDLIRDQTSQFTTDLRTMQIHRNKAVVCNNEQKVSIVSFPQGNPILSLASEGKVKCVAINSSLVAVATEELLTIYSVFTGATLHSIALQFHIKMMYLLPGKLVGFEKKAARVWYFDRRDLAKTVNAVVIAPKRNNDFCMITIPGLMKCISERLGVKPEPNVIVCRTIKQVEGERILAFQAKSSNKQPQHPLLAERPEIQDWVYEEPSPVMRYVSSSAVVMREVWNEKYQEWNFADCESSYFSMIGITYKFFLVHKGSSGLVLDVDRRNTAPLTPVIIWNRKTKYTENQLWSLELWKEDWFVIRSHLNNLVIGIASSFDISPSTSPVLLQVPTSVAKAYTLQTEECQYADTQLWRYDEQKETLQNKGTMYFLNVVKGVPVVSPRRADCWEFGREFM